MRQRAIRLRRLLCYWKRRIFHLAPEKAAPRPPRHDCISHPSIAHSFGATRPALAPQCQIHTCSRLLDVSTGRSNRERTDSSWHLPSTTTLLLPLRSPALTRDMAPSLLSGPNPLTPSHTQLAYPGAVIPNLPEATFLLATRLPAVSFLVLLFQSLHSLSTFTL